MVVRKRTLLRVMAVVAGLLLFSAVGYLAGSLAPSTMPDMYDKSAVMSAQSPGADEYGSVAGAPAPYASSTEADGLALEQSRGSGELVSRDSLVITTASMELRVEDVDSAVEDVRSAARTAGAEISNLTIYAGGSGPTYGYDSAAMPSPGNATITLRVPADAMTQLERALAGIGSVISQSASSDDVTEQAIDLDARLKNLRAEEATLRTFLKRTAKVSELLEVERELSRVRGEIESMDAQLTYLQRQAARATLTVSLVEPDPITPTGGVSWDLRQAFARGIAITAGMLTSLVTIAVPLVAVGLVLGVIAWPVRIIVKRRRSRETATASDSHPDGPTQ